MYQQDNTAIRDHRGRNERNAHGRFQTTYSFRVVLDHVARVIEAACPGRDPEIIGRRRYEQARAKIGSPAPSAQALTKRFGMPFAAVVELALANTNDRVAAQGGDNASQVPEDYPDDLMLDLIRAAALELDRAPSAFAFDAWAKGYAARRSSGVGSSVPHSVTIINRFGSWRDALDAAGFKSDSRSRPRRARDGSERGSRPAFEILAACMTEVGGRPSHLEFFVWCQDRGIQLGDDATPWERVVECAEVLIASRGVELPARAESDGSSAVARDTWKNHWTRETCLAALGRYGERYLNGAAPRQNHYRACSVRDVELPSPSTLQKFGRFQDLCREAGL